MHGWVTPSDLDSMIFEDYWAYEDLVMGLLMLVKRPLIFGHLILVRLVSYTMDLCTGPNPCLQIVHPNPTQDVEPNDATNE